MIESNFVEDPHEEVEEFSESIYETNFCCALFQTDIMDDDNNPAQLEADLQFVRKEAKEQSAPILFSASAHSGLLDKLLSLIGNDDYEWLHFLWECKSQMGDYKVGLFLIDGQHKE